MFACTGFVCVIAIVRLKILARANRQTNDPTWALVPVAVWSAAEPAMGVIAACLPSLRPLLAVALNRNHIEPNLSVGTSRSQPPAVCTESSCDSVQILSSTRSTRFVAGREKVAEFEAGFLEREAHTWAAHGSYQYYTGRHTSQGGTHLRAAHISGRWVRLKS